MKLFKPTMFIKSRKNPREIPSQLVFTCSKITIETLETLVPNPAGNYIFKVNNRNTCSSASIFNFEHVIGGWFRLLLNEHTKNYLLLLVMSERPTMTVKRLCILGIETFKTFNGLNLDFMTDIVHYYCNSTHKKYNLQVHNRNTLEYGNKNLYILGGHIWNCFPKDIKSTTLIYKFEEFIKGWYGCKCYVYFNTSMLCLSHHINIFSNLLNSPKKYFHLYIFYLYN